MKVCILMGSPRLKGNTAELCKPFISELEKSGAEVRYITLADKDIAPCRACYCCQDVEGNYGCAIHDDMYSVAEDMIWSDCIVLATPIFTWYCTAQMKNVLDRHYGLNKFYRSASGSFLKGKSVALLLTHGYDFDYACSPFVDGIRRFCEHSSMNYLGAASVRDKDDLASFKTPEAIAIARAFADKILSELK